MRGWSPGLSGDERYPGTVRFDHQYGGRGYDYRRDDDAGLWSSADLTMSLPMKCEDDMPVPNPAIPVKVPEPPCGFIRGAVTLMRTPFRR